jgi:hypothetical protein
MTNQQHPITPPPELLQLWFEQHYDYDKGINELLIEAAQYGADQELQALLELLDDFNTHYLIEPLRAARRPKPPSLKEQALKALHSASFQPGTDFRQIDPVRSAAIRRALESLPDD